MKIDIWFLFEIGINLYQAALITYFVRQRFHLVRPQFAYGVLCTLAIWAYLTLYLFVDMPILDTCIIVIPLVYALLVSDDKWYVILFWNAVLSLTLSGVVNLMFSLYIQFTDASVAQLMSETPLRVPLVVSCNIALLCIIFLETRISRKNRGALSLASMVVFLTTLILELAVIELLYTIRMQTHIDDMAFTAASLCMLACSALSLLLYELMSASAAKQKRTEAELEAAKLSQSHYEEMKDMYAYMIAHEHDMKHQMQLIRKLYDDGHMQEGQKLLKEQPALPEVNYEFMTGCVAMDALLTVKKLAMDRNQIVFDFQPYPLHELPITESKFCSIISNLLDNAIEGISRIDDQKSQHTISLKLARSWDIFFISCENDMNPASIHRHGRNFLSSKQNAAHHGFGTRNICSIVDEAKGYCKFVQDQSIFRVEITLPYATEINHDT